MEQGLNHLQQEDEEDRQRQERRGGGRGEAGRNAKEVGRQRGRRGRGVQVGNGREWEG